MVRKFITLLAFINLVSCQTKDDSPVSSRATHPVTVTMGSYTTARFTDFLIPSAYAAVSDLTFCFKRMRFKKDITDIDDPLVDENIDLNLGEISISSAGTNLGVVSVPADTYYRIEFDLEPSCAGKSVSLSNDWGVFTSAQGLKIKFDGVFVVNGSETLQLGIQDILNAANAYDGSGDLSDALEAVSGNL